MRSLSSYQASAWLDAGATGHSGQDPPLLEEWRGHLSGLIPACSHSFGTVQYTCIILRVGGDTTRHGRRLLLFCLARQQNFDRVNLVI